MKHRIVLVVVGGSLPARAQTRQSTTIRGPVTGQNAAVLHARQFTRSLKV